MLQNNFFMKRGVEKCLVKPVVLYGCEEWVCENGDIVNKLKLRLCKYIGHVNKSTCFNVVYRDLRLQNLTCVDVRC